MRYAVHRHTAVELIGGRANSEKEHMGLTIWQERRYGAFPVKFGHPEPIITTPKEE